VTQHMEALERANTVRLARAKLKRDIKAREVMVAEVLAGEIPDWLRTMRLEELCNAIPRYSWRHFQRLMQKNQARLTATVGDLTWRKRQAIAFDLAAFEVEAETRRARRRSRANGAGARAKAAGA
jgi:hypothetical protein